MDRLISIIVSTYNASQFLTAVLSRFDRQSDRKFEIIIADDGSDAVHRAAYGQFCSTMSVPVRTVWHDDRGFRKTTILNEAIRAAAGDYLVFTDGDCIPEPDYVAAHRRASKPGAFLFGGRVKLTAAESRRAISHPEIVVFPNRPADFWPSTRVIAPLSMKTAAKTIGAQSLFERFDPTKATFNGCNSSCWKGDALAIGGFDQRMGYGGEDVEFGLRLGKAGVKPKSVRYSARCAHLHHDRPYRSDAILRQNLEIIAATRAGQSAQTAFGIGVKSSRP